MKKQHIVLILLLILVGGYYLYTVNSNKTTTRFERRDFAVNNIEQVDKIVISSKVPSRVELTKEGKVWMVNNKFPARPSSIGFLMKTLDKMEIKHPVQKNSIDPILTDMTAIGIKVEIYKNGKKDKTIYIGSNTPDEKGTYMMLEGALSPYAIHIPGFEGYLRSRFIYDPILWRTKELMNIDQSNIEWLTMEYPNKKESGFKMVQEGQNISLFDLKGNTQPLNNAKAKNYLTSFKNIAHEGFITLSDPVQPEEIITLPKIFKLTIKEKGKEPYTLRSFQKTEYIKNDDGTAFYPRIDKNRLFATDGDSFFLIQYFVFNPMLKQITDFK